MAYEVIEETQLACFDFEGAGWAYATDLGGWYVDMPETVTELPIIGETYIIKCVHKPTGTERFYNAQCKGTPSGVSLGDLNSDTPFQISISKSDGSVTVANVGLFLIDDSRTNYYLYILHRNTNIVPINEKFIPEMSSVVIKSSTASSTKKFRITVDDSGTISATEVTV